MKVVFLVMSDDMKMDLAIRMAANSINAKRYEDLKVIFFGPSQAKIPKLQGDVRDLFNKLMEAKAVDSACVGIADAMKIRTDLERLGVSLAPAGERLAQYVNNGYEVITF